MTKDDARQPRNEIISSIEFNFFALQCVLYTLVACLLAYLGCNSSLGSDFHVYGCIAVRQGRKLIFFI